MRRPAYDEIRIGEAEYAQRWAEEVAAVAQRLRDWIRNSSLPEDDPSEPLREVLA